MKPAVWLLPALLIVGCSNSPRQPDTREWHSISCSTFKQVNFCQREAYAICPHGYDIYNVRWSEAEQRRYMEIACKDAR